MYYSIYDKETKEYIEVNFITREQAINSGFDYLTADYDDDIKNDVNKTLDGKEALLNMCSLEIVEHRGFIIR